MGVAGGNRKHRSIRAAVEGGLVDILVTDQETGSALMA
ncbi:sugar-binding domain-containing protein [Streptomyces sp. NPDC058045]